MKNTACVWCWKLVKAPSNYDELQQKVVCSPACWAAEYSFTQWMSDKEVNRRAHYRELTRGEDDV